MTPKQKKVLIVTIPTVLVFIIVIIIAILYFSTDFLKSDKTLFLKYMSQNFDTAKMIIDNTNEKEYANILRQNKYESTGLLTADYTQNINTSQENKSSDINKLKLSVNSESDYINQYEYKNYNLKYNNQDIFICENVHDGDIYGVRFPQMFSQFLSVENYNLKEVAKKAGLTEKQIESIPDMIEEKNLYDIFSFTDEELAKIQDKYMNIISVNIPNDKFKRQKGVMITVAENSITANAYSLSLTKEQANEIYVKILEELKNDDIILNKIAQNDIINSFIATFDGTNTKEQISENIKQNIKDMIDAEIKEIQDNNIGTNEVKYTVYEQNGKTVRTSIINETQETTIDTNKSESGIEINIQNINANSEQENTKKLKILKNKDGNEDEFSIEAESTIGEKVSTIEIFRTKNIESSGAKTKTGIIYNGEGNKLNIEYDEEIEFVDEINRITLDEKTNVILNNYDEERVSGWIKQVEEKLNEKFQENSQIINNIIQGDILGQKHEEVKIEQTEGVTEVEKNRFNAKYEFYAGEDIESDQILNLVEATKDSLKNAQVSYSNDGLTSSSNNKKLQSLRLEIEKGKENANLADSVKDMIDKNKKYKVEIQYDDNTGVVSFITITVNN